MALPTNKKRKIFDGRYEVLAIVGRGSESVVYHARLASNPNQEVALKVLLAQKDKGSIADRLRKEALTLVSCRQRYVVRLDDFHAIGDLCYLSMEFAKEGDLRKYVTKLGGRLPVEIASRFLEQMLDALRFVHESGVIHRDVKPDNILALNENESRLADFGLALLPNGDDASIEDLKSGVGTFDYLPAEVLQGVRYDQRSDLYALGICFYEMITGSHPFNNVPLAQQIDARADSNVRQLVDVVSGTDHISAVIGKLVRFSAEDRFQSAAEALRAIRDPQFRDKPGTNSTSKQTTGVPTSEPNTFAFQEQDYQAPANLDEPLAQQGLAPTSPEEPGGDAVFDIFDEPEPVEQRDELDRSAGQPTEKLDLERIKEIIAKDAKQKAEAASRRAARERSAAQAAQKAHAANGGRPRQAPPPVITPNKKRGDARLAFDSKLFLKPLQMLREMLENSPMRAFPIVIVFIFATLATVIFVIISQWRSGSTPLTDEVTVASNQSANPSSDGSAVSNDGSTEPGANSSVAGSGEGFPLLAAGLYAGSIEGVVPGSKAPFALISLPKQGMVAVVLGIEGWTPVMVPVTPTADGPAKTLVVRSNGAILNITAATNSDTMLEGTFSNAVTGTTGTWRVTKIS